MLDLARADKDLVATADQLGGALYRLIERAAYAALDQQSAAGFSYQNPQQLQSQHSAPGHHNQLITDY